MKRYSTYSDYKKKIVDGYRAHIKAEWKAIDKNQFNIRDIIGHFINYESEFCNERLKEKEINYTFTPAEVYELIDGGNYVSRG